MIIKTQKIILTLTIFLFSVFSVSAATLTCEQISDASLDIPQFSSKTIEIKCSASGGTVSSITITPNTDPSSGVTITSTQTISSSISDSSSSTAKWSVRGDTTNDYTISYSVNSDGTDTWDGASTTNVEVTSPAQLTVEYVSPPSKYSSDDTLDVKITNIGGATANNIKLKLNLDSIKSYPATISAGAAASYSWTSITGYDKADTYTTKVYIGDVLQDSVSTTVDETTNNDNNDDDDDDDDSSSSSAAAGGGGSLIVENFGNLSGTGVMDIEDETFSFTQITVDVTGIVENAKLYVTKLSSVDETYPVIEGIVYQYTKVSGDSIIDAFEDGAVKFKVDKSWISSNGAEEDRIFLLRYNGNNWVQESATKLYSETDYVYYKAEMENLGMFAVAYLNPVELDYLKMSSLKPELIDVQMVIESGLSDALMISRIEDYLFKKLNVKRTIEISKELVESLDMNREVKSGDDSSVMTIRIKNNKNEPVSFIFVEAVPKSIVHDVYALKDFNPRKYDFIIREDPVIQWSFGEADTSIVAWEVKNLKPGDEAIFSYSLDAVFDVEKYPAPIIIKPFIESDTVEAAQDSDDAAVKSSSKMKVIGMWFSLILILAIIGMAAGMWYNNRNNPPKSSNDSSNDNNMDAAKTGKEGSNPDKGNDINKQNVNELKLKEYVKKQMEMGKDKSEIQNSLTKVGWDRGKIDQVMNNK